MPITDDPNDPRLKKTKDDGQQEAYVVLSEDERAKGFVRPYRDCYKHLVCNTITTMGRDISETYARNPKFYGATFCVACKSHFNLKTADGHAFEWVPDGTPVGD